MKEGVFYFYAEKKGVRVSRDTLRPVGVENLRHPNHRVSRLVVKKLYSTDP